MTTTTDVDICVYCGKECIDLFGESAGALCSEACWYLECEGPDAEPDE